MPRRRSPEKRKVIPDPKYKDIVLARTISLYLGSGITFLFSGLRLLGITIYLF